MEAIEEVLEEDEYEPPPHVVARLGHGLLKLYRIVFPERPARTQWRYVWPSLFLALTYACFAGPVFRYFPARFHAERYWHFMRELRLAEAWYSDHPKFWRLLALAAYQSVLRAPFREELLYRGLPILLARYAQRRLPEKLGRGVAILIAIIACLEFALIHNRIPWTLPLAQLTFGAIAWWVAWRRGIRYSMLMHATMNLIYLGLIVGRIWTFAAHR